ncbi:MAG: alpha/beta hydrolase [Planctomycetota bacterium]
MRDEDLGDRTIQARVWASISVLGLLWAGLLFAMSLTPSLLPRVHATQGLLSGIALAVGYGVGVSVAWLWRFLELPEPRGRARHLSVWLVAGGIVALSGVALWRVTIWQDSVRELMGMPMARVYRLRVVLIAVVLALALVVAGKLLLWCFRLTDRFTKRVVPRRVAHVLSTVIFAALLVVLANGVLARSALRAADAAFQRIDEHDDEEDIARPEHRLSSGGPESLIAWDTIGRRGKEFIVDGPSESRLGDVWGEPALRPIRVYVGLRSAESKAERAGLALEELKRVGGFDRSVLVVATPTGTGWLEPGAVDSLEYLHAGDTAIVSMQYSYLPSWLTMFAEPNRSINAANALFHAIYDYWRTLPGDDRPRLYLHGLSLGALGSETCADLFGIFEDPIHGAVWSGPPFPSGRWSAVVEDRGPDSPAWLPTFRDGSMIRFTGRKNALDAPGRRWGRMRFVYIQHASDPMTFFSPSLLYRRPDWLVDERGPDVSPYLSWYPLVTFLQVACDLPMSTSVPPGHGHTGTGDSR